MSSKPPLVTNVRSTRPPLPTFKAKPKEPEPVEMAKPSRPYNPDRLAALCAPKVRADDPEIKDEPEEKAKVNKLTRK